MKRALSITVAFYACFSLLRADEERLWLDAKINGRPVKLVFDTGAERSVLLRPTAESLGLRITNWPAGKMPNRGRVPHGWAQSCVLSVGGRTNRTTFAVIDLPAGVYTEVQGILGWDTWRRSIIGFDCVNGKFATYDRLPEEVSGWPQLDLRSDAAVLILQVPEPGRRQGSLLVDTGNEGGVSLSPQLWKEWIAAHPNRKKTIDAYYMPGSGLVASELSWADELTFGPLRLHEVPVREANATEVDLGGPRFRAALGLTALKRLDLVVDGKRNVAYWRVATSAPVPYEHNRAGAVFLPEDLEKSEYLTARVLPGSPAYEANVRDGDVLLKIDDLDASRWRTDPALQPQTRFWDQPAGTKVRLVLRRGAREFQTEITLRDLIGPEAAAKDRIEPGR